MHELSVALSIIDIAAAEADRLGARSVRAVHLRLGPLAGVACEALVSAFELARGGTRLAAARLQVEAAPMVIHCPACDCDVVIASLQNCRCPGCGALGGEVVSGRELEITALEIEP
jgi:hydrogenase nickel incorporation protein HypA/HybF